MLADDAQGKDSTKSTDKQGSKKSEKSLTIGARMADHDLSSRLKNIIKWLNKRHEVRILIQGNVSGADEGNVDRIVKAIEATIKEPQVIGKIVQKRQKENYVKFNIIPMAPAAQKEESTVKQLWQPMGLFTLIPTVPTDKPLIDLSPIFGNLDTVQAKQNYSTFRSQGQNEPDVNKSIVAGVVSMVFMFVLKYVFWIRAISSDDSDESMESMSRDMD